MPNRPPLPVTRAILLADTIVTEAGTGKKTLVGIYSHIVAIRMPCRKGVNIFAQLADLHGEYVFDIELVRLDTEMPVHRGQIGPVSAPDRLTPIEIVFRLPCQFEKYGTYEFRILHEGNIVGSRQIAVHAPPPGEDNMPDNVGDDSDEFAES